MPGYPNPIFANPTAPGQAVTQNVLTSTIGRNISSTKTVFIGGTGANFPTLANPANCSKMLASNNIGIYQHGNALAAMTIAQRNALYATWAPSGVSFSGQGQTIGEVGEFTPVPANYLAYFGGSYPNQVNMNVNIGATGNYTASSSEAVPGKIYTGYTSATDYNNIKAAIDAAVVAGAKNVGVFLTPNVGPQPAANGNPATNGEDLDDSFASGGFWQYVRKIAAYGGVLAFDVPPTYFFARGAPYMQMIAQMVRWCNQNNIASCMVVSPYTQTADSAGNVGGNGYDSNLLTNTQNLVNYLYGQGAFPSQWVVESYNPGGTENDVETDSTPGSLNQIALYLAGLSTKMQGTALAGCSQVANYGLMSNALSQGEVFSALNYVPVQNGTGPGQLSNLIKIGWNGSKIKAAVDATDMGNLALESWVSSTFAVKTNASFTGSISGDTGIELGQLTNANTPYIDFHSSGQNLDYDARILAQGGGGNTVGEASLNYIASLHDFTGAMFFPSVVNNPSFANDAAAAAGGIKVNQAYRNGSQFMVRVS